VFGAIAIYDCPTPGCGASGWSWAPLLVVAVVLVGAAWRTHRAMERAGSQRD
jgi:uncharacterized protein (TIGR03382 family)